MQDDISTSVPKYLPFMVGVDDPTWPALADPTDRWNGWLGAPWFDRETAVRIANDVNPDGFVLITVDDEGIWKRDLGYDLYPDTSKGDLSPWRTDIDGIPRATIGAWEWCWSEWPIDSKEA